MNYPHSINSKLPNIGTTIFSVMSKLAADHQAINLSQGFPDFDCHEGLAPVGCYGANSYRIYDMVGNIWDQTKDVYTASHQALPSQTVAASATKPDQAMVIKGGSHLCGQDFCVRYRPSAREAHEANLPISHIGFRTVFRGSK